jgi:hypothetical protein
MMEEQEITREILQELLKREYIIQELAEEIRNPPFDTVWENEVYFGGECDG